MRLGKSRDCVGMIGWPCMADKATPGLRPFADVASLFTSLTISLWTSQHNSDINIERVLYKLQPFVLSGLISIMLFYSFSPRKLELELSMFYIATTVTAIVHIASLIRCLDLHRCRITEQILQDIQPKNIEDDVRNVVAVNPDSRHHTINANGNTSGNCISYTIVNTHSGFRFFADTLRFLTI